MQSIIEDNISRITGSTSQKAYHVFFFLFDCLFWLINTVGQTKCIETHSWKYCYKIWTFLGDQNPLPWILCIFQIRDGSWLNDDCCRIRMIFRGWCLYSTTSYHRSVSTVIFSASVFSTHPVCALDSLSAKLKFLSFPSPC